MPGRIHDAIWVLLTWLVAIVVVSVFALWLVGPDPWRNPHGKGVLTEPCRIRMCEGHKVPAGDE